MSKQRYDIIDAVEDAAKVSYSVGAFAAKFFYQASNLSALKNGMDSYIHERFIQRLEYFTFEHDKLSDYEKKIFYEDLISNKQNMNYLYEFVEKARTSSYDIHAKILARLSVELIKNGELNYHESNLLANISLFNNDDFKTYYEVVKNHINVKEYKEFGWDTRDDKSSYQVHSLRKFISLGFFDPDGLYNRLHKNIQKTIFFN